MSDGLITLNAAVWAIFAGIVLAVIYTALQKSTLNLFIMSLYKNGCFDSTSAKTLAQLGISSKFRQRIVLSAAKTHTGLNRLIGAYTKRGVKNFGKLPKYSYTENDRFFIDESKSEEAKTKYRFKKSKPVYTVLVIIALALAAAVSCTVITWLSGFASNSFKNFGTSVSDKQVSGNTQSDKNGESAEDPDSADETDNSDNIRDDIESAQGDISDGKENQTGGENETSDSDAGSSGGAVIPKPNPTIPQPNIN